MWSWKQWFLRWRVVPSSINPDNPIITVMLFGVIRITVQLWNGSQGCHTPSLLPSFLRDEWYFGEKQIWVIRRSFVNAEGEERNGCWMEPSQVRQGGHAPTSWLQNTSQPIHFLCVLLCSVLRPHERPVWYFWSFNLPPKAALHLHKRRPSSEPGLLSAAGDLSTVAGNSFYHNFLHLVFFEMIKHHLKNTQDGFSAFPPNQQTLQTEQQFYRLFPSRLLVTVWGSELHWLHLLEMKSPI